MFAQIIPINSGSLRARAPRRGFTLIEVLVTMVVIVILTALAIPLVRKPLLRHEVQSAGDTVRTKMQHARIGAMKSSHVYTFQYQPGSGSYRVSPQDNQSSPAAQTDAASSSTGQDAAMADGDHQPCEDGSLPEGLHFLADDSPDPDSPDTASAADAQSGDGGNGWSDPIFFYPDGTTSDARLIVASGHGYAIHIRIRGVSGNVALGNPVVE
jgi:prepilin-type N-terminal cleavage/methylation domain-containing protein